MIIPRKDTSVIVAAAGMGQRLGLGPKALLQLDSHSLIWWVTRKALRICDDVIVAAPEQFVNQIQREALECRVIAGGDDRQQSIAALVAACSRKWVVLLDVARPFASSSLCVDVLAAAGTSGIATAVEALQVPAVRVSDGRVVENLGRSQIGLLQAPQAFDRQILLQLLADASQKGWFEQSLIQLALRSNLDVAQVAGEVANFKITTREEWQMAQHLVGYLR